MRDLSLFVAVQLILKMRRFDSNKFLLIIKFALQIDLSKRNFVIRILPTLPQKKLIALPTNLI